VATLLATMPAARGAGARRCARALDRPSPRLGARHCGRRDLRAVARAGALAGGLRRRVRQEASVHQRALQRHHARRPLFSRRHRLHADLRPDAQRQSGARLALFVRRLHGLRGRGMDRFVAVQLRHCVHCCAVSSAWPCSSSSFAGWRARICARRWSRSVCRSSSPI
jgi:hypothetical protein